MWGGGDIVDKVGGVCRTEGVATARHQSRFLFKSFVEGEKVILPCLQDLVLGNFAVPFGAILWGGVRLEEQRGCNGGEKVV